MYEKIKMLKVSFKHIIKLLFINIYILNF